MRKLAAAVCLSVVAILAAATVVLAQDPPPQPPCCPRSPISGVEVPNPSSTPVQAVFTASEEWLQFSGLTRTAFANRLAAFFFPAGGEQYLLTWKRTVIAEASGRATSGGGYAAGDDSLVQVEEKYTYRFRRSELSETLLETADDLLLTDGITSIRVVVQRNSGAAAAQP